MNENTDDYRLRKEGDVYLLKPKILALEAMMFVLAPAMLAFVGLALYKGAATFTGVQIASSVFMMAIMAGTSVMILLGRSSLLVSANEVAFRLGAVWRRRSLQRVRTCHTKPLPKGYYSVVELELEDGTRKNLTRLRNGAADRLADLICEVVGAQTPADAGREAIARPLDVDFSSALCTADELVAGQPEGARNALLAVHALLERRWDGGRYDPPPGLAARLTDLGFRRIGSGAVLWTLLPVPIKAATYVNDDGTVVAELLRSEGDKYHFVSHTTTPMVRWSWSKIAPTTKSSEFVHSAPTTGSLELDYAAHRDWLAEQVRQGAKIAAVSTMEDYLTLARFRSRRLTSDVTVVQLLAMPFILLLPLVLIALREASR